MCVRLFGNMTNFHLVSLPYSHKTLTVRAFKTHYWHLEIKWGVEYLLYSDSQQFVYEEVWLLKDVKNDLCAHVHFMVLSILFNFYSHSN